MVPFLNGRRWTRWIALLMLVGAVWLGVYGWDQGFTKKWRGLIAKELARHGLRAEIGRLTLDPVEGLTARDVKLFDVSRADQQVAAIDRISLDIDLARLVNREDFLRTLHLQKADVSLPMEPGDPRRDWLTIRDLNARLVFQEEQIEIAQAEGQISGVLVKVSGRLRKPPPQVSSGAEKDRARQQRRRQLQEMGEHSGVWRKVLRAMERFQIPPGAGGMARAYKGELSLEVEGDLAELAGLEVRAQLSGGALVHRGGAVEGFEARASLSDGLATLERLEVRDRYGALHGAASWKVGDAAGVEVAFDCSMDVQGLLRSALEEAPWLGEVVCYTPPELSWEGRWNWRAGAWPLEGQGRVRLGRFLTRGVVFEGLSAKVALKPEGHLYVREGVLRHHSGEVRGQLLLGPQQGRYEVDWRMGVEPLRPFLPDGGVRKWLERFAFNAASSAAVRLQGDRGEGAWRHAGRFQLRDFSYQGTALGEAAAELLYNPAAECPLVLRHAALEMAEGGGKAREVRVNAAEGLLTLVGAEGTLMPAPLLRLFQPSLAKAVEKYRFAKSPETRMEGVIDLQGLARSDYRIALRTRRGVGLEVAGQAMDFAEASGAIQVQGPQLSLQLSGTTAPGVEVFDTLRLEEAAPTTFEGSFPLGKGAAAAWWKAELKAPGRVSLKALRRSWPLEQFAGQIESKGGQLTGTGEGALLGGKFGATLEFPKLERAGHSGSLVLEKVSFAQLAAVIDPARRSEGLLSGNFSYQISGTDPAALQGRGEARLEEGNLFALPLLGPLSALLDAVIPGEKVGYSVARSAATTFTVGEGKVRLPDFAAATTAFKLTASGEVDYVRDRVDLLARVNLRGAPGMLLYPVSKLFEYAADGTLAEPSWNPRYWSSPFRVKPVAEPAAETIEKRDGPR